MKRRQLLLPFMLIVSGGLLLSSCAPTQTLQAGADGYTLRPALRGERRNLTLPGYGRVTYYADPRGTGRPLVLVHAINAAGSAYEMKPLWDAYVGARPVYALEFPGFGSSERRDVQYTPELMTNSIRALVAELGSEVDVVALSLGSEFAARAALDEPRIKSLALISPSGFGKPKGRSQTANSGDGGQQLYKRLNAIGRPLYAALRTRTSIHYFLSRSFRKPVPSELINYAYDTTRQPGAQYAPLYFVSGRLFTPDAYADLYSKLKTPTLVLYDQDGFVSFDRLPLFAQQANASVVRIADTDGMPHWEKLSETEAALDTFWQKNK